jgi:hypothetical protein
MSRMLHNFLKHFQRLPRPPGGSTQHERDMPDNKRQVACQYHTARKAVMVS